MTPHISLSRRVQMENYSMTSLTRPRTLRRLMASVVGVILTASVVTACGSDDGDSGDASSAADNSNFPVTVETAYGDVTMEKAPERVVALTSQAADLLVEIGVQPIAFAGIEPGDGESTYKDQPWLDGRFDGELDEKLLSEYQAAAEHISTLEPDLIVGSYWTVPEEKYSQLSDIAPTYTGLNKDEATDWDVQIEALGQLTGHSAEAEKVVADMETTFADARDELPGLQGKTYSSAAFNSEDKQFVFGSRSFLEDLGLVPAESQQIQSTDAPSLSFENMSQLTGDVLNIGVWQSDDAQSILEASPAFKALPAQKTGTVFLTDIEWANASNAPTPASLRWLLDKVVPQLKESALNK